MKCCSPKMTVPLIWKLLHSMQSQRLCSMPKRNTVRIVTQIHNSKTNDRGPTMAIKQSEQNMVLACCSGWGCWPCRPRCRSRWPRSSLPDVELLWNKTIMTFVFSLTNCRICNCMKWIQAIKKLSYLLFLCQEVLKITAIATTSSSFEYKKQSRSIVDWVNDSEAQTWNKKEMMPNLQLL